MNNIFSVPIEQCFTLKKRKPKKGVKAWFGQPSALASIKTHLLTDYNNRRQRIRWLSCLGFVYAERKKERSDTILFLFSFNVVVVVINLTSLQLALVPVQAVCIV